VLEVLDVCSLLPHLYFHAYIPLQSCPVLSISLARFAVVRSKEKLLSYNHKAKAMNPATPANTAPPLTIFMTAPPFDDADAEAAEPDAVDDDPAVLDATAAELDAAVAVAVAVELAEPPETGVGVGLPSANLKFAQARRVRLCAWMTMLRLPKKEFRPGSVDT
jgi:hypothetical protein